MTSRRSVLQALALAPLVSSCVSGVSASARNYTPSGQAMRRVDVKNERVIRTIAGLRPFRQSGFVVKAEGMNDKIVIHNYGHGGGGITLSWGTSHLAMELAMQTQHKRCAVVGAGIVGLSTARLMQDRGWDVTIYSKALPPRTTSNVAGGQWSPTSVYDEEYLTPAFEVQFEAAMRHAFRYYQNLVSPKYGVSWISNYQISSQAPTGDSLQDKYPAMYPQLIDMNRNEHPFDADFVRHYSTMLVEPAIYLPMMLQDYYGAGGKIEIREFMDRSDVLSLEQPVIFNCTGLGSKKLFEDPELMPIKGQLSFLLPQAEVNYIVIGNGGLYMFPRHDGVLLGGTFERNEWSLTPDPVETQRIVSGHKAFFDAMDDPWS
ncbi:MAG: FAD-dependent oxidoreductase [SAR86 cluster bacterium]|uniref:D-amino-acid oxidase n=1 Tax=SAR86 cluster bacterium TaxID=2030880 RepID=A0A2A5AXB6_9GAMM|nr:MAG: FAD-dependent oxidoreductase [SAR86 cluster bacterium]